GPDRNRLLSGEERRVRSRDRHVLRALRRPERARPRCAAEGGQGEEDRREDRRLIGWIPHYILCLVVFTVPVRRRETGLDTRSGRRQVCHRTHSRQTTPSTGSGSPTSRPP